MRLAALFIVSACVLVGCNLEGTSPSGSADRSGINGPATLLDGIYVPRSNCSSGLSPEMIDACRRSTIRIENGIGRGTLYQEDLINNRVSIRKKYLTMAFSDVVSGQFNVGITMTDELVAPGERRTFIAPGEIWTAGGRLAGIDWQEQYQERWHRRSATGQTVGAEVEDRVIRSNRQINARREEQRRQAEAAIGVITGVAAGLSGQSTGATSAARPSAPRATGAAGSSRTGAPRSGSSGQSTSGQPFVRQDLRDFTVTDQNLQICVWDNECEDGDRVSVQVQGDASDNRIRTFELRNAPACFRVRIEDRVSVVLKALNGTGFKGQCSHENENTGVMSVSGGGGQSSWSLQGGTGTSGRITYRP